MNAQQAASLRNSMTATSVANQVTLALGEIQKNLAHGQCSYMGCPYGLRDLLVKELRGLGYTSYEESCDSQTKQGFVNYIYISWGTPE